MRSIVIAGTGSFLPERLVTNDEIEARSGYDRATKGCSLDRWARRRHGGGCRYWVSDDQATSDLALGAARRALEDAKVAPQCLELLVVSTFTSDHPTLPTAARVQEGLGTKAKFLHTGTQLVD